MQSQDFSIFFQWLCLHIIFNGSERRKFPVWKIFFRGWVKKGEKDAGGGARPVLNRAGKPVCPAGSRLQVPVKIHGDVAQKEMAEVRDLKA